jgi:hypothetical protein
MQNHLKIDLSFGAFSSLILPPSQVVLLLYQDSPSCNESQMITLSSMTDIEHGFQNFKKHVKSVL